MVDTNPEVGDPVSADFLAYLTRPPIVRLIQVTAQSIPNASSTALTFDSGSEDIDTHNFHDVVTNNSRITPTSDWAGYYEVTVTYATSATTATQLYAVVAKNGVVVQPLTRQTPAATSVAKSVNAIAIVSLNGTGDYVEGWANQNSGGALNTQVGGGIQSTLELKFLRPL